VKESAHFSVARPALGAYFAQGVGPGLISGTIVPILATHGFDLQSQAGILGSAALPWLLKVPLGLLIDQARHSALASVRLFLGIGQVILVAGLVGLVRGVFQPLDFRWLVAATLLFNFGSMVQDTAIDTLICDHAKGQMLAKINAWSLAVRAIGQVAVGGVLLAELANRMASPMLAAMVVASIALVLIATFPWRHLPGIDARPAHSLRQAAREFLRSRGAIQALVVAITLQIGIAISDSLGAQILFQSLHLEMLDYTRVLLPLGAVVSVLGYLSALPMIIRYGAVRILLAGGLGIGSLWFALATLLPHLDARPLAFLSGYATIEALFTGWLVTAAHTLLMQRTEITIRATQLVIYMTAINLSRVLGSAAVGLGAKHFAARELLFGCGGLQIALGLLYFFVLARPNIQAPAFASRH
jgi:hypothetical protein